MIATLRLEWIGHNTRHLAKAALKPLLQAVRPAQPAHRARLLDPKARPWVARIEGRDPRHGLARSFLKGLTDYRDANGVGSRGVMLTFVLYEGHIYEVHELVTWTRTRRYFCRVEQGRIVEMTLEEVTQRLDASANALQDLLNKVKIA